MSSHQTAKLSRQLLAQVKTLPQFQQLSQALELLAANANLRDRLHHLASDVNLTDQERNQSLNQLISQIQIPLLRDYFLNMIAQGHWWIFQKEPLDYFDQFVSSFQRQSDEIKVVHVVLAIEIDVAFLADFFTEMLKQQVMINYKVKPKIIGGIQIKIDNLVYDYSVRTKLRLFEKEWIKSLTDNTSKLT